MHRFIRAISAVCLRVLLISTAQPVWAAPLHSTTPSTPLVFAPQTDVPPALNTCFATLDGITVYASVDASAVQQAVDVAAPGDNVKVAGTCAGVQARASTTQTVYISQTLTLMGGFTTTNWLTSDPLANPTTLDALTQGRVIYATAAVTVSDLTAQYGNINGSGGGALFDSTATLIDTLFFSSTADNGGGAFFVGTATLTGSQFSGNNVSVSGGGAFFNSTATLTGTAFSKNTATFFGGGAAFVGIATLTNTQFSDNTTVSNGGGATFSSNATLTGSLFRNNLSTGSSIGNGGGGVWAGGRLMITDTQFINNRARISGIGIGGGLYLQGTDVRIVNTLFAGNSASAGTAAYVNNSSRTVNVIHTTVAGPTLAGGSAFFVSAGTVNITNTLIASHTVGIQRTGGTANENYTLFSGVTTPRSGIVNAGSNSITGTAFFANPAAGDYQLTIASTAIDAGANAGLTTDYFGNARPLGDGFDIGFHEFVPPYVCLATPDNGTTVYSSTKSIAVQLAVDAAAPNGTVKVAGYCAGVQTRASNTQTVIITKALTLAGGFTTTNWTTSDPTANPTTLDALFKGRVISATAAVTLSNFTVLQGNTSSAGGGAWFGSAATLTGTQFLSNTASTNGGGAFFNNTATLTGTHFLNNNANVNGGGAYFTAGATLAGTQFISNTTLSSGGGAYFNAGAALAGTQFISNSANTNGGGAFFNSTATLAGDLFQNNRGTRGGGAYFVSSATLAGGLFQNNRVSNAGSQGGGAYFGGTATLTGTQFFNNTAFTGGGTYFNGPATLTGTQFISNTATNFFGGGAFFQNIATLTNAQFISNSAPLDGGGTAFFSPATLTSTQFISNIANGNGGGAYFQNTATLAGGLFQNNRSTNIAGGGGGAYFATTMNTIMLAGTQFLSNTASASGGALFANNTLSLTDTVFIYNIAGTRGGGLYLFASSSPSRIVNSVFARNLASSGDALYLADPSSYDGTIEVIHTTIASTTMSAGSAIVVGRGSVNLTNTLIASHTVGIERAGGTVNENFTLFSGVTTPRSGIVNAGGNSITGTAGFVNAANDNYRLTGLSSAANTGTNAGVIVDFDGNPRPIGAGFDIGAFEFNNGSPVADAGQPQTVTVGTLVTLTGVASSDPDDQPLAFGWSQVSGASVTLSDNTTVSPTFTAPATPDTLVFQLIVTDTAGEPSAPAFVTITVVNGTPIANAGLPQSALVNTSVTLDGSGSSDPDGHSLTYGWSQTGGMSVTLSDNAAVSPTFTTPGATGQLIFQLIVTDAFGAFSAPVFVTVTVGNNAPVANAGLPQTVVVNALVTLNGGASSDPDGHALTYGWLQVSGAAVTLSSDTAVTPTFSAPGVTGQLFFQLIVTDAFGAFSAPALITVMVTNGQPTANAGAPQTVMVSTLVTLTGVSSSDPEGHALTFGWSQVSGMPVMLSDANTVTPTFSAPASPDTLVFQLIVTDAFGLPSAPAFVNVTVQAAPVTTLPPSSVAFTFTVGSGLQPTTFFTATVAGGTLPLTHEWKFSDGITSTGVGSTNQRDLAPGSYVVTLTVSNNAGAVSTTQQVLVPWRIAVPLVLRNNP